MADYTQKPEVRKLRGYKPSIFKAPGSIYKKDFADAAVLFVEELKHGTGRWRGQKFDLIDWQERIIRDIFGIVRRDTQCRQFRRAYIEVPKKNGKSELGAAIALLLTCTDNEYGGEIYGCATDRAQATRVFDVAVDMVDQFPFLKKNIKLSLAQKRMTFLPLNSFYQVCSAEAYTKDGFNASGIIFDELHAQPDRRLFDVMTAGSGLSREQPLLFMITTAGFDRNSICYEQHKKAEGVLNGTIPDPTFYPVIFGAPDDADWASPEVWKEANPSYGITINEDGFLMEFADAQMNISQENRFRRLNLNQWVSQDTRWMSMDKWDSCNFPVDPELLKDRVCYGGLDLSSTQDMTAFVLVFPPKDLTDEYDKYQILPFFWIPREAMHKRILKDHVPYDQWQAKGLLETTDGEVIDYSFVEHKILELKKIYNIQEVAYDMWGAPQLRQNLTDNGVKMIEFGQGYKSMSLPSKEFLRLVLQQKIAHGGNEVLRWNIDNVVVTQDAAGNIKPNKDKATEKIDGAVATVMALARALVHEDKTSIYDNGLRDGLLTYKGGSEIGGVGKGKNDSFDSKIFRGGGWA